VFLTASELCELTGKRQPAAQRRVLAANGLRFFIRGDGHNSVPRDQLEAPQGRRPAGPDLDALARLA
jgi:hypothetical protein